MTTQDLNRAEFFRESLRAGVRADQPKHADDTSPRDPETERMLHHYAAHGEGRLDPYFASGYRAGFSDATTEQGSALKALRELVEANEAWDEWESRPKRDNAPQIDRTVAAIARVRAMTIAKKLLGHQ